ncbi:hypothetical protein [Pelagibaculum spongiae]|uniref:Imelysin-like domain-containing protein n=1 Tax=Pelagibaculum spongiae TaxID=2080658 RepID=A0A2V1GT43_9GAMM|nr:hypothetical protein [Pelagibaculum spongiae]PVZ68768.1 hypothetical protein DC094_10950 [Pelagibaculum spongiae]
MKTLLASLTLIASSTVAIASPPPVPSDELRSFASNMETIHLEIQELQEWAAANASAIGCESFGDLAHLCLNTSGIGDGTDYTSVFNPLTITNLSTAVSATTLLDGVEPIIAIDYLAIYNEALATLALADNDVRAKVNSARIGWSAGPGLRAVEWVKYATGETRSTVETAETAGYINRNQLNHFYPNLDTTASLVKDLKTIYGWTNSFVEAQQARNVEGQNQYRALIKDYYGVGFNDPLPLGISIRGLNLRLQDLIVGRELRFVSSFDRFMGRHLNVEAVISNTEEYLVLSNALNQSIAVAAEARAAVAIAAANAGITSQN